MILLEPEEGTLVYRDTVIKLKIPPKLEESSEKVKNVRVNTFFDIL